jgi:sterol desaturase/sphingolipid hydroxylase (fatty acid hydroxylase superfamily)
MDAKYIAIAVPFFFVLIGVELAVSRKHGRLYRFHDSIGNLSSGIGQQLLGPMLTALQVAAYVWFYEHARLYTISPNTIFAWIGLLFAEDLCYHLFHRASHRVNVLWAAHAVHHQSEELNLSVALRQSWLENFFSTPFKLPLAILGFPPAMFLTVVTINILYQFWIHTRVIGRVGPLEWVLNTPSHHRVHHGCNPRYLDRNYGGMFILWDRLFGTFAREEEEPVYGLVKPLASFNPLWANVEYWVAMAGMSRRTARLRDKILVWLAPPEWRPADLGGVVVIPEVDRATFTQYDVRAPLGVDRYVKVSFPLIAAAGAAYIALGANNLARVLPLGLVVMLALIAFAGLIESKPWAFPVEYVRLTLGPFAVAWLAFGTSMLIPATVAMVLLTASLVFWLSRLQAKQSSWAGLPQSSPQAGTGELESRS